MDTATCLVIIFAALFEHGTQAITNPGTPELRQYYPEEREEQFSWRTVSRQDEYSAQGTTYYSPSRGWYRFDASKGENQLFVFPNNNSAFYYFPYVDEDNKQRRQCWKMALQQVGSPLPSPIQSEEDCANNVHFNKGSEDYYDELVTKFENFKSTTMDGINYFEELTILYRNNRNPNQYPLQSEFKQFLSNTLGEKDRLTKHEVTVYFNILPWEEVVWTSPITGSSPFEDNSCIEVQPNDFRGKAITSYAEVVHVPKDLLIIFEHESMETIPQYRTGGVQYNTSMPSANADDVLVTHFRNDEIDDDGELPAKFDWRDSGAVTSVKNQRECGSCWAFGVVAALESAYFLKHDKSVVLSEQFLIDCAWNGGNFGCAAGGAENTFKWIKDVGGIPLSEAYGPYKNMNGECLTIPHEQLYAKIDYVMNITPNDPNALKHSLKNNGPIVVHVMGEPMFSYTNGIIDTPCDSAKKDHFVLLVGYGETEDSEPYWIIKNSWGNTWGMDGYLLVSAKPDENCICILDSPLFPVLMDAEE